MAVSAYDEKQTFYCRFHLWQAITLMNKKRNNNKERQQQQESN